MYYVGIDIGKTDHCMGAIDGHGTCISKPWMFKQTLEHFDQLNGNYSDPLSQGNNSDCP